LTACSSRRRPTCRHWFAALRNDEEQTARFLGTVAGTVVLPEFFDPENIAAIVGAEQGSTRRDAA
jgi:hypothetical protein